MFEDTFERIGQFFQLAVVIAQQLPRDILDSREKIQHQIDNPGEWGPRLRSAFTTETVVGASAPKPKELVEDLGWIEIDPTVPFEERKRRGNYKGGVHSNITADKSQLKRKVRRHIVLYDPQGYVSNEDMKRRIRENGDRPCDLDDGLGIGEIFPKRQVVNPLPLLNETAVCLGSDRDECAPVLYYWGGTRKLDLSLLAGDWDRGYRFPAVREEEYLDT